MDIRYETNPPAAHAFKDLYDTTGWGSADRRAASFQAALDGSWAHCAAFAGDRLVGYGRVISDGVLHAFICEMIIAPEFQHRGIGSTIVATLVRHCRDAGVTDIQLFCAEGKEAFYRKAGFAPRAPSKPGMQYVGFGS